ncbi:ABC transporter permease [Streptomyces sp. NBC_00053]|uniref:FtsX-like permease family protein n=1 Tax=unclassified Streptomyces TaxID=2593676 RepID=UPI00224CA651|nr:MULTISPECIES: FtsX-like permease family protein [unclassified Streptomyces]WSX04236.1 ABC transporter permease [Streptomyces sp. NBC_00987]MCX4393693.1 ABC transporter permease [Streptomyces sp. NBC_01767]MCX5105644.1 ABC transporter permease [Streptomyces sp. NBC_00439]MCX5163209.1 ABC transporter permease [Streptomyces sp. NBC_00305]MCX5221733.1 ABC transporter permease [Streptomyces sp. NBC_00264]
MREFSLGLRLLFGSGRGNRARFLLMLLGGSLGVCCLALVLTIPAILDAHDGRSADREPQVFVGKKAGQPTLVLQRSDPHGSKPFSRVFVARGTDDTPEPPPGLSALPGPGEVFVSPALRDQLRREPGLRGLLPGREEGLIGPAGLTDPNELYAYVGTSRDRLGPEARALKSFGSEHPPTTAVEASTLDILRFTLAALVLLPLAVFLSVCAKLSAASRNRRLAALRLLGLSRRGTQRVNAAETVVAALFGAALGLGEFWVLNQIMARTGLPGLKWYPDDGSLSASTIAVCLIGCPALAWFVGRASARTAAADPLSTRRTAAPRAPRLWGGLLLIAGLGLVAGYCATGFTDHPAQSTGMNSLLVPAGVLLTGAGLVMVMPLLSYTLARRLARSGSLALSMAMRRNEVEPGSAMRVVTGLVLLVFSASLAQGVLVEERQITHNDSPSQEYSLSQSRLTEDQQRRLRDIPGVAAHALVMEPRTDPDAASDAQAPALVATCAQFAKLVRHAEGCVEGEVLRLSDPQVSDQPLTTSTFLLTAAGRQTSLKVEVPRATVLFDGFDVTNMPSPGLLVPPSALPAHAKPVSGRLVLAGASDPASVRAVLDRIGAIAPTADVDPAGINIDGLQQITVIETLLALGMVMGLVIGVAAFLVSVTDRAVERRPQVTALSLLGARARTLRLVQCTQVLLPLAIGLVLALVAGKAAESAYLITGGGEIFWDGAGVPLLVAAMAGVLVLATVGTWPLVGRRIDPELIRRD